MATESTKPAPTIHAETVIVRPIESEDKMEPATKKPEEIPSQQKNPEANDKPTQPASELEKTPEQPKTGSVLSVKTEESPKEVSEVAKPVEESERIESKPIGIEVNPKEELSGKVIPGLKVKLKEPEKVNLVEKNPELSESEAVPEINDKVEVKSTIEKPESAVPEVEKKESSKPDKPENEDKAKKNEPKVEIKPKEESEVTEKVEPDENRGVVSQEEKKVSEDKTETLEAQPRENAPKNTLKQSSNVLKMLKQLLAKAKKTIITKSPSSKTVKQDAKGEVKVK